MCNKFSNISLFQNVKTKILNEYQIFVIILQKVMFYFKIGMQCFIHILFGGK